MDSASRAYLDFAASAHTPVTGSDNKVATAPSTTPATVTDHDGTPPLGFALAQLHGVYILAENAQGLIVVDMHAAHERILYERLKQQMDEARLSSQPLLIPATFAATAQEVATAEASAEVLHTLGLEITPFSPRTLAVRAVPTTLAQGDAVELARSVLAELAQQDFAEPMVRLAGHGDREAHDLVIALVVHEYGAVGVAVVGRRTPVTAHVNDAASPHSGRDYGSR